MIPADDVLEALDLSRAEPGSGFLEALFARFNAKVPFENASKIVRNGGTCFARAAAFEALLSSLGFRSRKLLGRVRNENDHAALLVETAAGEVIADVGFPLPAILPARAGLCATSQGEMEVAATERGFRIAFLEGTPETPRELEVYGAPVPQERFTDLWRETFRPNAVFLQDVTLRRDLGNRVLSFGAGEVRVDDLHSRLRVPAPAPREAALSQLFGIDADVLAGAFAIVGGSSGEADGNARLTAYLETDAAADRAFAAVGTRDGYRKLLEGVADVTLDAEIPGGFRLTLSAPSSGGSGPAIEEDVSIDAAERRVACGATGAENHPPLTACSGGVKRPTSRARRRCRDGARTFCATIRCAAVSRARSRWICWPGPGCSELSTRRRRFQCVAARLSAVKR